eukprot:GHVL01021502.1.p1 GENE.GHVL01021502.1~~GHVL01021502.1.p1  ORF type:complete len:438 (-),score=88.76 GHVL01021502.1:2076-3389(-)
MSIFNRSWEYQQTFFRHFKKNHNFLNLSLVSGAAILAASFNWSNNARTESFPETVLFAWGCGLQGQLGIGDTASKSIPQVVSTGLQSDEQVCSISSGTSHSAFVSNLGRIFTWGSGRNGRLGHDNVGATIDTPKCLKMNKKFQSVICGDKHTLGLTCDGEVWAWGDNSENQCGAASCRSDFPPTKLTTPLGAKITQLATGYYHNLALTESGKVLSWGSHQGGALGIKGLTEDITTPTYINDSIFDKKKVKKIGAGKSYSAALTEDGEIYTWGMDKYGELGVGKISRKLEYPHKVEKLSNVTDISCGIYHMAAVSSDGFVHSWGYGGDGATGHGNRLDTSVPTIVVNPDLKENVNNKDFQGSVKNVFCGGGHTAALTNDGRLFLWGRGREGQLGRAQHLESVFVNRTKPLIFDDIDKNQKIIQIALGGDHSLCLSKKK